MPTHQDTYNIALDCIDKNADSLLNKHKTALILARASFSENKGTASEPPLRLSFAALKGLTNRMANVFHAREVRHGKRVLLRLANGSEFPISFLGAIKSGAIPIPSSPLFRWHELKYLLEDSGAWSLVTTPELLPPELLKDRPATLKHILLVTPQEAPLPEGCLRWQRELKEASPAWETLPTSAKDPAFWLYTSGTTGQPKAAIHAHSSIRAHDARARLWQDLKAGDVAFHTSALNWSYALTAGMLDLWRHGLTTVVFQGELSTESIAHILRRFGVTLFMSVPGLYRRLNPYLIKHPETFAGVRVCLSAGESLPRETREKFRLSTGLEIYEGLGMTEHSIYLVQPFGETPVPGSVGRPLPSHEIKILREDLSEVAPGETGILASHRHCEGLMLGYHQGSEEDLARFQGEWFLSGDLANRDEAGNFFYVGRRDDVITAGGYRISPLEVERELNRHPVVRESAVVGATLQEAKTVVRAYVVLNPKAPPPSESKETILSFCRQNLASYKVPREIIFVEDLPKTPTGKLKRKDLSIRPRDSV